MELICGLTAFVFFPIRAINLTSFLSSLATFPAPAGPFEIPAFLSGQEIGLSQLPKPGISRTMDHRSYFNDSSPSDAACLLYMYVYMDWGTIYSVQ